MLRCGFGLLWLAGAAAVATASASSPRASASAAVTPSSSASPRALPRAVVGGYSSWGHCGDDIVRACEQGVNVVYWFAINLAPSPTGLDLDCIANVSATLRALSLPTTHMVSVGGWDAPHPTGYANASAMYSEWKAWNEHVVARPGLETGFDGVDWDLEGADNVSSPTNSMTPQTLDLVGGFSQLAKADGYLVTLVPCESYLDPTTSRFDGSLLWAYPEWHPEFKYHGHNAYAYLLSRYGTTVAAREPSALSTSSVQTFDAVTIQLYESFAHASFNTSEREPPQTGAEYLESWVPRLAAGWDVDFGSAPEFGWPSATVSVPAQQLVLGLGNGWAGGPDHKSVLLMPDQLAAAWASLAARNLSVRGGTFWSIPQEGTVPPAGGSPLFLAIALNSILHTRD
jgi:hypothetical protein